MIRTLFLVAGLMLAAPVVVTQAVAATSEELDLMKAEVDYANDTHKAVAKLADDWKKNQEKEKDNAETEKELKQYLKVELEKLRELGIPTVADEEVPEDAVRQPAIEPEPREKLIELRDLAVALKSGKNANDEEIGPKPYAKKLDEFVAILAARAERKQKFYDKEKEASK